MTQITLHTSSQQHTHTPFYKGNYQQIYENLEQRQHEICSVWVELDVVGVVM